MREIRNAKITSTMLGFEGHGIFTCMVQTKSGAVCQGFGGYGMGGEWGIQFFVKLLKTLEVETWESLPGMHCRVDADHMKIHRIGHIIEDKWFDPSEDLKKYLPEEVKP